MNGDIRSCPHCALISAVEVGFDRLLIADITGATLETEHLEQVFELLGSRLVARPAPAIDGIPEEDEEIVQEYKGSPVLGAGLVAHAVEQTLQCARRAKPLHRPLAFSLGQR